MSISTVKAVINGTTYTLTLNSSTGRYEGQITAPSVSSWNNSGKYFPISVTATDTAGNSTTVNDSHATLGNSLKLTVKEITPPVITITAPTEGQRTTNSKPTVTFTVTDNDSGVDQDTIKVTIDSTAITTGITKTPVTNGFQCSYTPTATLTDGTHTIKVDAKDNDGNSAIQRTVSLIVDTVPPTLSVTAPVNNLITNKASVTVVGTTNDATSSPCTVTVKLNSGTATAVTVAADGSFSKALTLANGSNTITIVSTDTAGKSTTVSRTVILDVDAPVISKVEILPNPVNVGNVYTIAVTVTD